jgi:hypothetical protein
MELELRPAWKLLTPIVGPVMKRRRRSSYASLKRLIESTPSETNEHP